MGPEFPAHGLTPLSVKTPTREGGSDKENEESAPVNEETETNFKLSSTLNNAKINGFLPSRPTCTGSGN